MSSVSRNRISRRSIRGSGSLATGLSAIRRSSNAAFTHLFMSCTTRWMVAGARLLPSGDPRSATQARSAVRSSLPSGVDPNTGRACVRKNCSSRAFVLGRRFVTVGHLGPAQRPYRSTGPVATTRQVHTRCTGFPAINRDVPPRERDATARVDTRHHVVTRCWSAGRSTFRVAVPRSLNVADCCVDEGLASAS